MAEETIINNSPNEAWDITVPKGTDPVALGNDINSGKVTPRKMIQVAKAPWDETPVQNREIRVDKAPWDSSAPKEIKVEKAPWDESPVQKTPVPVDVPKKPHAWQTLNAMADVGFGAVAGTVGAVAGLLARAYILTADEKEFKEGDAEYVSNWINQKLSYKQTDPRAKFAIEQMGKFFDMPIGMTLDATKMVMESQGIDPNGRMGKILLTVAEGGGFLLGGKMVGSGLKAGGKAITIGEAIAQKGISKASDIRSAVELKGVSGITEPTPEIRTSAKPYEEKGLTANEHKLMAEDRGQVDTLTTHQEPSVPPSKEYLEEMQRRKEWDELHNTNPPVAKTPGFAELTDVVQPDKIHDLTDVVGEKKGATNAVKEGEVKQGGVEQHQGVNENGTTAKASGGDSTVRSGEVPKEKTQETVTPPTPEPKPNEPIDSFVARQSGDITLPKGTKAYRGEGADNPGGNWWGDRASADSFAKLRENGKVTERDLSGKKLADAEKYLKDPDDLGNSQFPARLDSKQVAALVDQAVKDGYDGLYSARTRSILLPDEVPLKKPASVKKPVKKEGEKNGLQEKGKEEKGQVKSAPAEPTEIGNLKKLDLSNRDILVEEAKKIQEKFKDDPTGQSKAISALMNERRRQTTPAILPKGNPVAKSEPRGEAYRGRLATKDFTKENIDAAIKKEQKKTPKAEEPKPVEKKVETKPIPDEEVFKKVAALNKELKPVEDMIYKLEKTGKKVTPPLIEKRDAIKAQVDELTKRFPDVIKKEQTSRVELEKKADELLNQKTGKGGLKVPIPEKKVPKPKEAKEETTDFKKLMGEVKPEVKPEPKKTAVVKRTAEGLKRTEKLNEGVSSLLNPVEIVENIRGLGSNIKEGLPHLERLGRYIYEQGKTKLMDWAVDLKSRLGDLWKTYRPHIAETWKNIIAGVKAINEKVGSTGAIKTPVGIKREITDALREMRGQKPLEATERNVKDIDEIRAERKTKGMEGDREVEALAEKYAKNPEGISENDIQRLKEYNEILEERNVDAFDQIEDALKRKDASDEITARRYKQEVENLLTINQQATRTGGNIWSKIGDIFKNAMEDNYSLDAVVKRAEVMKGVEPGKLDAATKTAVEQKARNIMRLKKQLREHVDEIEGVSPEGIRASSAKQAIDRLEELKGKGETRSPEVKILEKEIAKSMKADGFDPKKPITPEEQKVVTKESVKQVVQQGIVESAKIVKQDKGKLQTTSAKSTGDFLKKVEDHVKKTGDVPGAIRGVEGAIKKVGSKIQETELKILEEGSKELKRQYASHQKNGGKITDPQAVRIRQAYRAVEKSIAIYKEKIAKGDLSPIGRGNPVPVTPELKALRLTRDSLKTALDGMRKAAKPPKDPAAAALAAYKKRLTKQYNEIEAKRAAQDFSKPPKRERKYELDREAKTLIRKLEEAKFKLEEDMIRLKYERFNTLQKAGYWTLETGNLMRALKSSCDLSATYRQGGFFVMGDPMLAIKSLPTQIKAFRSKEGLLRSQEELETRPNFPLYEKAKLELTTLGFDVRHVEEAFKGRLAAKIPIVEGSQRAYTAGLNKIRADVFDKLYDGFIKQEGRVPKEAELKAIGDLINIGTGRYHPKNYAFDATFTSASNVLFAPRLMASRFVLLKRMVDLANPVRLKQFKETGRFYDPVEKLFAKQVGRYLAGVATFYALGSLWNQFAPEEHKVSINLSPADMISGEWGKVRIGKTRIDPLSGLQQTIVFLSRMASGLRKNPVTGEVLPLRPSEKYGKPGFGEQTVSDVILRFVRSKVAPLPGTIWDWREGSNFVGDRFKIFDPDHLKAPEHWYNFPKQVGRVSSLPSSAFTPMVLSDAYEAMLDRGVAEGTALALLAALGFGMQTYEDKKPKWATGNVPYKIVHRRELRKKALMKQEREELIEERKD